MGPEQMLEIGDLAKITTYKAGAIQQAAQRTLDQLCDEILSPYQINKTQWLIIGFLLDAGPEGISIKSLAPQLNAKRAYLSKSINLLEKQGIVRRVKTAGTERTQRFAISPGFEPECHEIERTLRTGLREAVYSQVTPIEFRVYLKVLYQLSRIS